MGASERAEFIATLNATAVDAGIKRIRGDFVQAAGKMAAGFNAVENTMRQSGAATSEFGKAMIGVTSSAGNVAMAFTAGGPLLGGLALGMEAVGALTKHWDDLIKKEDEYYDKQVEAPNKLIDQNRAIEKQLQSLRKSAGLETAAQVFMRLQTDITKAEAERALASQKHDKDAFRFLDKRIEMLKEIQTLEAQATIKKDSSPAAKAKSALDDGSASDSEFSDFLSKWADADEEAAIARFDARLKIAEAEYDAKEKSLALNREQQKRWVDIEEAAANAVVEKHKAAENELRAFREHRYQEDLEERSQLSGEMIAIGVGSAQTLTDALITGQEKALEHFAASVMSQAGSAMIGHGINAAAGGIAMLSLGNPAGAGALATGAGLIAGGVALGGIGSGIEHTLAGGQIGKALPDEKKQKAERDRGVDDKPRGSGSSGGKWSAGGMTIVNNYQVGGPIAEDAARANQELSRTAERRRMRG